MKFPKKERCHKRNEVSELFSSGHFLHTEHFKLVYTITETNTPELKMGISVPKKHVKLAVNRNKTKRRTSEALRLNKAHTIELCKLQSVSVLVFFIYKKRFPEAFSAIEESVISGLKKLEHKIKQVKIVKEPILENTDLTILNR